MLLSIPILVPNPIKTDMHIGVHPLTARRFHLLSALKMLHYGRRCGDEIDTAPIFAHDSLCTSSQIRGLHSHGDCHDCMLEDPHRTLRIACQ